MSDWDKTSIIFQLSVIKTASQPASTHHPRFVFIVLLLLQFARGHNAKKALRAGTLARLATQARNYSVLLRVSCVYYT